jgi:hypothetical protein
LGQLIAVCAWCMLELYRQYGRGPSLWHLAAVSGRILRLLNLQFERGIA